MVGYVYVSVMHCDVDEREGELKEVREKTEEEGTYTRGKTQS